MAALGTGKSKMCEKKKVIYGFKVAFYDAKFQGTRWQQKQNRFETTQWPGR